MANCRLFVPYILKWEGGFSDDSDDPGGATMKGITIDTYRNYCKLKNKPVPTINDLKYISPEEWYDVLKLMFWDKWQADRIISQSVAEILVDWVWVSGKWGIILSQKELHLLPDGIVGYKTLQAVNYSNP